MDGDNKQWSLFYCNSNNVNSHRQYFKFIFKEFKIITLPSLFILNALMFIRLNFNAIACAQFYNSYNTRKKEDFQYIKYCLILAEKSPMYMRKKILINLPNNIKE